MSVYGELKRLSSLAQVPLKLELYENMIKEAEPLFELKGQNLEDAVKAHISNLALYDMLLQECKVIEDYVVQKLETLEAQLHKHYLENAQRALGARDLSMYIKGDPQYVEGASIRLEVAHTRQRLESIVEAFKSMSWSLSNIVKLRIDSLEHVVL